MPREIAFHGVYIPTMTLMFLIAAGLAWALIASWPGSTCTVFLLAPGVAALSLFVCLFGALALTVYR